MHQPSVLPRIQVSNYDVLLDSDGDSGLKLIDMNHVGNKRIEVFLNLYRNEYCKAKMTRNLRDMDLVVHTILKIVCSKCIRRGRFLERNSTSSIPNGDESEWTDLGQGLQARKWLHQSLSNAKCGEQEEVDNEFQSNNNRYASEMSEPFQALDGPLTGSLKRQRRGSHAHLRRTSSEGSILRSIRTTLIRDEIHNENRPFSSSRPTKSVDQIVVYQPMDVVFTSCPKGLAPTGNPGNARLRVMIGIHASSFGRSDMIGKRCILGELSSMVQKHWKGRFLVQKSQNSYEELSEEAVSVFIHALLVHDDAACRTRMSSQPCEMPPPPTRTSIKRSLRDSLTSSATSNAEKHSISCFSDQIAHTTCGPSSLLNGKSQGNANITNTTTTTTTPLVQLVMCPSPSIVTSSTPARLRNAAISFLKAKQKKRMMMERFWAGKNLNHDNA